MKIKCEVCHKNINQDEEPLTLKNKFGATHMHDVCFDDVWGFWLKRKEIIREGKEICRRLMLQRSASRNSHIKADDAYQLFVNL